MKPLKALTLVLSLLLCGASLAQATAPTTFAPMNSSGGGGIPIDLGTN
ncbi:hypothetical protein [Deinococcus maricopensis]|uniref:Uncharacterized protein n=1 Tax=Deinococcus maricopensis (strain DSM 21211 / LMG 22137 / NRRL B-23946 / LB-34) TaxID=709986 RepID=E8U5L0_DEIML|nr:hypothetical protein [Deinococcus maricopensis]ADV66349.1 hypothetical protein Deima_0693 [Deinococcus maricopensis DSM 21211]